MKRSAQIKYINYEGPRYEATVPDTLDLAERGALAVNGLTMTCDPDNDYLQWWWVNLNSKQPSMVHWGASFTCTPKFAQSLALMRVMSGSTQNLETDQKQMDFLVSSISPDDGLYYVTYNPKRPWHLNTHSGNNYDVKLEDIATVVAQGVMLLAMLVRRQLDRDPMWDKRIQAMVRGLDKIAVHKDDYAYFPDGGFGEAFSYPKSGWRKTDEPKSEHEGGEGSIVCCHGHQLRALALWGAATGDKQALELARQLFNFLLKPKFWGGLCSHPVIIGNEKGQIDSHVHARAIALRGILEYGIITRNARACNFVRSAYEYIRTLGIPQIGWIPSLVGNYGHDMEACYLGDELALAIKMSDAGLGDYWDDVDCITRNHLVEMQYTRRDLLQRMVENSPERKGNIPGAPVPWSQLLPGQVSDDNVIDRAIGIFGSLGTPVSIADAWTMQCCSGNATQGLYYAWEGITRCQSDSAQINLLLNRAAPWLDIDSYLPYEGKVVIHNKTTRRITVRIPMWVDRTRLVCSVDGKCQPLEWVGNYFLVDNLKPKNLVEINFPVSEETVTYNSYGGTQYTIRTRGNTVVDISPRDDRLTSYPFYLRDDLKTGRKAPIKRVTQFVFDRLIAW